MKKSFLLVSLLISIVLITSIHSSTYSQVKKQNNIIQNNKNDVFREKLAISNKQIFDSIEYTKRKLDSINKVEYNIRQIKLKMKNEAPILYSYISNDIRKEDSIINIKKDVINRLSDSVSKYTNATLKYTNDYNKNIFKKIGFTDAWNDAKEKYRDIEYMKYEYFFTKKRYQKDSLFTQYIKKTSIFNKDTLKIYRVPSHMINNVDIIKLQNKLEYLHNMYKYKSSLGLVDTNYNIKTYFSKMFESDNNFNINRILTLYSDIFNISPYKDEYMYYYELNKITEKFYKNKRDSVENENNISLNKLRDNIKDSLLKYLTSQEDLKNIYDNIYTTKYINNNNVCFYTKNGIRLDSIKFSTNYPIKIVSTLNDYATIIINNRHSYIKTIVKLSDISNDIIMDIYINKYIGIIIGNIDDLQYLKDYQNNGYVIVDGYLMSIKNFK